MAVNLCQHSSAMNVQMHCYEKRSRSRWQWFEPVCEAIIGVSIGRVIRWNMAKSISIKFEQALKHGRVADSI